MLACRPGRLAYQLADRSQAENLLAGRGSQQPSGAEWWQGQRGQNVSCPEVLQVPTQ